MKMAELERRSGVSRETIRYYIREGLLPAPARKKRNVAAYGDVHLARLKSIRKLQEEHFLPLDVIRRVLDGDVAGLPAGVASYPELGPLLAERLGLAKEGRRVPLSSLAKKHAHAVKDAQMLARLGVIGKLAGKGRPTLSALDARIVVLWSDLRAAGFTEEFGFSPADTDVYVEGVARMAAIEVERFFARMGGKFPQSRAAELAQSGVEIVNGLLSVLRIKAILQEIARRTPQAAPQRAKGRTKPR